MARRHSRRRTHKRRSKSAKGTKTHHAHKRRTRSHRRRR